MSKPWEQEWKAESLGYEARVIRDTNDYVASAQYAYPEGPVPLDDEDAVFISAAPDMARALLSALEAKSDLVQTQEGQRMRLWLTVEQVQAMSAALHKAGAL